MTSHGCVAVHWARRKRAKDYFRISPYIWRSNRDILYIDNFDDRQRVLYDVYVRLTLSRFNDLFCICCCEVYCGIMNYLL